MTDLRNTIAHILEHKQHLAEANEATIQQYVVLPILRALGWNDTNLASMAVLPEYAVEDGRVDYALKVGQKLALFLECKKWNESLNRHENQIVTYAVKAGMPIVCLTNGKIWRFYFSWIEGTPVRDRIFCEIDIEDREAAISDLEKYLLKSNVASGEAKSNAEIALEEKGKSGTTETKTRKATVSVADTFREGTSESDHITIGRQVAELRINSAGSKPMSWRRIREKLGLKNDEFHKVIRLEDHFRESVVERIESFEDGWEYGGKLEVLLGFDPVGELRSRIEACKPKPAPVPNPNPVDDVIDNPSEKRPITFLPESDVEWTIDTVRKSLSQGLRAYYEKTYSEERRELFYGGVAGIQNCVKEKGWKLNQAKFSKMLCGFRITDKGVIGTIERIFGILPQGRFPDSEIADRDGKLIPKSSIPPRLFVRIAEEEAEQLELKHDGCKFCSVEKGKSVDYVYHDIPEKMSELLPVLEFAYKKHTGTNLSENTEQSIYTP